MTNNHPDVPQTIHECEDLRVVLLSQYADHTHFQQTIFRMAPGGGAIITLSESSKPRATTFSAQELDALCTAWTRYRADRQEAERQEKERIEAMIREAQDLVKDIPATFTNGADDPLEGPYNYWRITCPTLGVESREYEPEEMLAVIKKIVEDYRWHTRQLAEARTLAEQIGLTISEVIDKATNTPIWTLHEKGASAERNVDYYSRTAEAMLNYVRILSTYALPTPAELEAYAIAETIGRRITKTVHPEQRSCSWTVKRRHSHDRDYPCGTDAMLLTVMKELKVKHDAASQKAEAGQQENPEAAAKALVAAWPAIRIHERDSEKEGDTDRWYVGVPDIAFGMWANTPDGFLSAVEAAVQALNVHQDAEAAQ